MVNDKPDEAATPSEPERPKRPPPTIDLDPSEVSRDDVPGADSGAAQRGSHWWNRMAAPNEPSPHSRPSLIAAAVAGALAATVIVGAIWLSGWFRPRATEAALSPNPNTLAIETLATRIARVEAIAAAPKAPDSATATQATTDPALVARIDGLDASLTPLRNDIAAMRAQSERIAAALNELKAAPRETAAPAPNLAPLENRLAQVEQSSRALVSEATRNAAPVDDAPLRRVVAASLLDAAVRQGEAYAAQLAAAKPLAADSNALRPLDAFAATGIPTNAVLSRELLALIPQPAKPQPPAAASGSGILDRLQASAGQLVRVQRVDGASDKSTTAPLAGVAAAARRGDVAEARREINALPPADRAALQPWADKVDARDAALAASRKFAADAMAAFGAKTAP